MKKRDIKKRGILKKSLSFILLLTMLCGIIGQNDILFSKADDSGDIEAGVDSDVQGEAWDGVTIKEPELVAYEYKIDTAEKLAWFAKQVNENNTFEGKSICITGNINLDNKNWPVIGSASDETLKDIRGNIVIMDATISGLYIGSNAVKYKGLFGSVRIWNMSIDNLTMENINIAQTTGSYDGLLFGRMVLARNATCVVRNSEISGKIAGDSACGAIAGSVNAEGDNAVLNIENSDIKINSTGYGTRWDGSRDNTSVKGGIIARYSAAASNDKLIMNGVICNVDIASYKEYGYDTCTAGGMIGELDGKSNVYIYQCGVKGKIVSSGYEGYAGGIVGKMISCNIYRQSDTYVTATIDSYWNLYGYPYNAGGFIEGPLGIKPNGFIKNSYYSGKSGSAVAFIAKDCLPDNNILKVYNSYYNYDLLSNRVYHANWGHFEVNNAIVDCNAYSDSQMKNQCNFKDWDFYDIWIMNGGYPELRRKNMELPDGFVVEEDIPESEIIRTVREYASKDIYSQWEKIWNGEYSDEVKFEKMVALTSDYGITDTKEGIEFVIKSKEKRWAYEELTTDDMYTASNFLNWLDKGGRALMVADGLIFNSEIDDWIDPSTYIESDYPGVVKYKDMLYQFMDSAADSIEVCELVEMINKLAKASGKITDTANQKYVETKINELNNIKKDSINYHINRMKIIDELAEKGIFVSADSEADIDNLVDFKLTYELDKTSGFGQFAKAMGLATKTISIVDMGINDIADFIQLDSKLKTYYQFESFLNDIIESEKSVPFQLKAAAIQVRKEINEGYLTKIKEVAGQLMSQTKISDTVKDAVLKKFGLESISGILSSMELEAWFINQIVDIGNMVKQASYVEGYAYLANLYKNRLNNSSTKFLNNMTEENAWDFYYNYNMLYCLRCRGEEAYLKMCKLDGICGKLLSFGYSEKQEATEHILTILKEKCRFDLGENVNVPESMKYLSKMIVSCPVNVTIYSNEGEKIAELQDGVLQDTSNEYGRFVVVYNYCTGDYQKVIYLKRKDVKIVTTSIEDGLVNIEFTYRNQSGDVVVKSVFNKPTFNGNSFEIAPEEVEEKGKIVLREEKETTEVDLVEQGADYTKLSDATLSEETLQLNIGESKLLKIFVQPENASIKNVTWYSSDSNVVAVRDGNVKACREGSAKIYCFLHDKSDPIVCNVISKTPDTDPPKVEISVGAGRWNGFDSSFDFNTFYKNTRQVLISASDNVSENLDIWYCISDREIDGEYLRNSDTLWNKYTGELSLVANSNNVIYAKATDEAGNITIVNSTGIVVYTDSAQSTKEIDYIKNVTGNVKATVNLNGNSIKAIYNADTVLKEGIDYDIGQNGEITFRCSYLNNLDVRKEPYTITVAYNPYGKEYVQDFDEKNNDKNESPNTTSINVNIMNPKLINIMNPTDIVGIKNGTDINEIILKLPNRIAIKTENQNIRDSKIIWKLDDITNNYDPKCLEEQKFEVCGLVELPDNIDNRENISLTTSVKVTVNQAGIVEKPEASVQSGTYMENKVVFLKSMTEGADIYYTIDGSEPSEMNGIRYTMGINLNGNDGMSNDVTIKAVAVKNGMKKSDVVEYSYSIQIKDRISPDIDIKIGDKTWNTRFESVTYNEFYNEIKEVSIVSTDNCSTDPDIWYYLADRELALDELFSDNLDWVEYNEPFNLEINSKVIIYSKAVDEAGNINVVNSCGIVVYTQPQINVGNVNYIKNVSGDVITGILLNGNTIKEIRVDNYKLVSGVDYKQDVNGFVTIFSSYLNSLESREKLYSLKIYYNPLGVEGNEIENTIDLYVKNPELISIAEPKSIIGVANGTSKTVEGFGLPKVISVVTEDRTITEAEVEWNLDILAEGKYSTEDKSEQKFKVNGLVKLPNGISNNNGVNLCVTVDVCVSAVDIVGIPIPSVMEGDYSNSQHIELVSSTEDSKIIYTLDGSEPSLENGNIYTGAIEIIGEKGKRISTTVKAVAIKEGMQNSQIVSYTYNIDVPYKMYTISSVADIGGTITPNGNIEVKEGDSQSFNIQPDNEYEIEKVIVDGEVVNSQGEITFTDINDNHTVLVKFKQKEKVGEEDYKNTISIVSGNRWIIGKHGQMILLYDGDIKKIKNIKVDGKVLDGKKYCIDEKSKHIILNSKYLNTLSQKLHTIEVSCEKASAKTSFLIEKNYALIEDNIEKNRQRNYEQAIIEQAINEQINKEQKNKEKRNYEEKINEKKNG